jgi:ATP-dependent Lon protease
MTEQKTEPVDILLEGLDETNIASILDKWKEIAEIRKKLDDLENSLKEKVKAYMKERHWDHYLCEDNKINVTLSMEKRESIDTRQLKMLLPASQLAQITRITTFEKLLITTKDMRDKMKTFMKKKPK